MREIICVRCPKGCGMTAELVDGRANVSGNQCKLGFEYAYGELIDPRRLFASTVAVRGSQKRLPVAVSLPVSLDSIMPIMDIIKGIKVKLPIKENAVIVSNILQSGADLVATRSLA